MLIKNLFEVNPPTFLMYSEEALIFNLILKDIEAIKFAYKKYAPALYGIIHNTSSENVDSIFIKSFKRICNTIDLYEPVKCRLFTWMYWIVIDEIKKNNDECP